MSERKYSKKTVLCVFLLILMVCLGAGCAGSKESDTSDASATESSVEVFDTEAPGSASAASAPAASESGEDSKPTGTDMYASAGDGPREHGQLRVEQGGLVDENGEKFQLRGMSTHGIGWFPNYINAGAMQSVINAGGNVMRVAMYTQADSGYITEPEKNMNIVLQAIENARAMDMYVIVDWHILDDGNPNTHLDKAITFFDAVASRYSDEPAILYEICNEPNGVSWSDITKYAYAICPVIRQYSPQAVIILGTPDYSFGLDAPAKEPFPRENILYSFHYYAGVHKDFSLLQSALEGGLPVIVSEWGIGADADGSPALDEGRKFADYLNEKGISWCVWSLCNKDEVFSVLRPDCNKLGGFEDSDLTDVGRLVFEEMGGRS